MNDKSQRRASYLIRFGYVGTHFHGLQPNPDVLTAGGALAELLEKAAGTRPKALQFSARTDAGVHALENYATCWFPRPFDDQVFAANLRALASPLLFVEAKPVPFQVHARANARGKWYRYVIEDASESSNNPFTWPIVPILEATAMQEAANHLVGTHAFDAFRHGGCSQSSTTKTLTRISVVRHQRQIHIDIEGTAFLRRMVRIIAGTLAQIGAGLRPPSDMEEILVAQRRDLAGPSAPASGLTLMRVGFTI
jgi:tRNA pseudouridine38-40 synthase